ncbi:hypothetical protein G3A43_06370 [Paraburkholderia aspalathi]|nr:hypothetical protein [Paraburkholderia aspalathi]MBK3779873.1 hypothetical protein [Paraburkholderia aspalathi]
MFIKKIVLDVESGTSHGLQSTLKVALEELSRAVTHRSVKPGTNPTLHPMSDESEAGNYSYREVLPEAEAWHANTLYVIGTNAEGTPVVRGTRTTFDAHKDHHIMESALELSQAVELRGVQFAEHQLGSLLVRPAPAKAEPDADVARKMYSLTHITDLADLNVEDVVAFAAELPTLVAFLKLTKQACDAQGVDIKTVMPTLSFAADLDDGVEVRAENGQRMTFAGSALQTAAARVSSVSPAEGA